MMVHTLTSLPDVSSGIDLGFEGAVGTLETRPGASDFRVGSAVPSNLDSDDCLLDGA